jgi:hypothetical protein
MKETSKRRNVERRRDRVGMSRSDVLVTLGVIGLIFTCVIGLGLPALLKARCGAATVKDKNQMKQIHQSMLIWSRDHNDILPTPSLVASRRAQDDDGGERVVEDFSVNHSAPLYSMLIAMQLATPEILVSSRECIEVNRGIRIKRDYNYNAYDPARGRYWDTSFTMRIDDPSIGANASFAHMALCGERRTKRWRNTQDVGAPILGTRGTRGGAGPGPLGNADDEEYVRSPTLRLHGARRQWVGNVAYADNHVDTIDTFYPGVVSFEHEGRLVFDNIYAAEFAHPLGHQAAADAFLGIFIGSTEHSVQDIYDPLE